MHDPEAFLDARAGSPPVSSGFIVQLLESLTWSPNPRILDYGCGPGTICQSHIVPYAEQWNGHIVGVDSALEMVHTARTRSAHPRVEYHQANLFGAGVNGSEFLAPRSYDIVICNLVLHFLKPHKVALARLSQLLKPGGQLGFVNMSNSPHYTLLRELGAEPKFKRYMEANDWRKYVPEWIETGVDFEKYLREGTAGGAGGLPSWLKIVSMDQKRVTYDLPLEAVVTMMYSVGPLAGRLPSRAVEEEVKEWYRQRVRRLNGLEEERSIVKGHWVEVVIGVLQREPET